MAPGQDIVIKIGIILGSTRPGRRGEQVARWVHDVAAHRSDAAFEVVDLLDHPLPHLDEPTPALSKEATTSDQARVCAC